MTSSEKERYHRQMIHPGFTEEHQRKLRESVVLLAGIGGLGGAIAYGIAGAGVGKIKLLHAGPLTSSNLNRQTLMNESALDKSRVETAAARLREFSRFVEVEAHDADVTENKLGELLTEVDLIIDARHNFPERRNLNRASVRYSIPLLYAAMSGLSAQMALFTPKVTGCLDCLYPADPPDWEPFGFPVFGAVAHGIGAMAALETVKFLSGYGDGARRFVSMDFTDYSTRSFKLRPVPGCPTCGG